MDWMESEENGSHPEQKEFRYSSFAILEVQPEIGNQFI